MGPAMDLTEDERNRIRSAYLKAANSYERFALRKLRAERNAVRAFLRAWDKLGLEEQAAVSFELARMVSPNGGDVGVDELELVVNPHDLDVGKAAHRAVEQARDKGGNKVRAPGYDEAIEEAANIWAERGNPRQIGNVWNPFTPGQPSPLVAFVSQAIRTVLPEEAIAKATLMESRSDEKLFQSVEARLRKSR